MAKYRQVHVAFWQDAFVLELTPEEKYFYLYLMTNSKTSQCGIYELPKRVIELETGYNRDTVNKLLKKFIDYEKIDYCEETSEIMVINWLKYNFINSSKVIKCIEKELKNTKNKAFIETYHTLWIRYGYPIDTLSIDYGEEVEEEVEEEKEEEEKEKKKSIPYQSIFNKYNEVCGQFMPKAEKLTKARKQKIKQRWNELLASGSDPMETIIQAFNKCIETPFLRGENDRNWRADIDWIFRNDTNYVKILEGSYNDPSKTNSTGKYHRDIKGEVY